MRTFNPYFKTYKALGTLMGTTAQIYATVQAVLDSVATRQLYWNTPIANKQSINAGDKCIAITFADFFLDDRNISLPLVNKYGFQASHHIPLRPLSYDYRNSNYWTRKEVRHIEMGGCYNAHHGAINHMTYPLSCPTYDGRTTPSNDDLRVDAGGGKNTWGHTITDTIDTSLTEIIRNYLALGAVIGATAWEDLTDANCITIRESFSVFKRLTYENYHVLEALDYLSARYCGTTGYSVYDNYITRTPNTADGLEPSAINPIIGGIFTGSATTQNHEIWERLNIITKEYKKEFENVIYNDLIFYTTSGGISKNINYGSDYARYTDRDHLKIASGASKYTSSITGESRSLIDCIINAGGMVTHFAGGYGYAYPSFDGDFITRLEAQRYFKYNARYHKADYVGDGYVHLLRYFDTTIPNADILTLLGGTDLLKEYYDYVYADVLARYTTAEGNNFYDLINTICKYISWGIIPDLGGDFIGTDVDADASATLALEALYQFCKRASIKVVSYEMAVTAVFAKSFVSGYNYFPNSDFETTPKTITASANAPAYPDGWDGGEVLVEDTGDGNTNVLHIDANGTIFTRQYAIKPRTFTLSFRAKGVGTLNIRKILNKDTFNSTSGAAFTIINTIAINSVGYAEYSDLVVIPDVPMETYSAPTTPAEECYQNYMKGYGDKICGIQIELIIAGGNYVKIGNCSLI